MGKAYLAKLARWGGLVVLVIALGLPAFAVQAGELAVKGQNISSKSESTWIQIGEDKGHGIGTSESMGITYHGDGEVSTYVVKGTYDWNNTAGKHQGYLPYRKQEGHLQRRRVQFERRLRRRYLRSARELYDLGVSTVLQWHRAQDCAAARLDLTHLVYAAPRITSGNR